MEVDQKQASQRNVSIRLREIKFEDESRIYCIQIENVAKWQMYQIKRDEMTIFLGFLLSCVLFQENYLD